MNEVQSSKDNDVKLQNMHAKDNDIVNNLFRNWNANIAITNKYCQKWECKQSIYKSEFYL